jgi:2-keto-4-pentenoate hydratase/2-oxohepta-3-ene-1,7-dioic acid hydratase in catechol pathway
VHPALSTKPASALLGHLGAIQCRPEYGRVHREPELAVVIGARAKNITAEEAYQYVFGYTIHNDITSPTMRDEDTFHYRAIHLQFVTRYMTLEPGDILSLGTALKKSAQGGAVQNVDLNRLGGPISVTIDRIGTLTNTVAYPRA